MFRKIHSKNSPGLGAALMDAFGSRAYAFGVRFCSVCQQHPKKIYSLMVLLMAGSLVLCFSIMRLDDPVYTKNITKPIKAASGTTANIGITIDKLQQVMALQAELQALSKKQSLTRQDSIRFAEMLKEIRVLTSTKK
ncbi:hypothetical protein [Pedobacter sp. P26]|uniref:hypothetical protein n=1 Tax=Pedobacter sp. P26 TaxID=3423956 RepID=UPI003D66C132